MQYSRLNLNPLIYKKFFGTALLPGGSTVTFSDSSDDIQGPAPVECPANAMDPEKMAMIGTGI